MFDDVNTCNHVEAIIRDLFQCSDMYTRPREARIEILTLRSGSVFAKYL